MRILATALAAALSLAAISCAANDSQSNGGPSQQRSTSLRMMDGKEWLTKNLNVATSDSYCFDDREANCRNFGRLYTWQAAQRACQLLGDGWRLSTDEDWRQLANLYGGAFDGAEGSGKAAYQALVSGGRSGFDAVLGGGRASDDGAYDDLNSHGFYWTASEIDSAVALFYNFARGGLTLYRQSDGEKPLALSVRCVR
jgi:uncharacterized protein (TIGR02145 family)